MKAKVIIDYIDRETRKLHKAGETVELTEKRFREINAKVKRVQLVEEKQPAKTEK